MEDVKNQMVLYDAALIQKHIYTIRGVHVMLDRDLAFLYKVETRVLIQAVKRNIERFPTTFCFQLTNEEFSLWKSQIVMSKEDKKRTKASALRLYRTRRGHAFRCAAQRNRGKSQHSYYGSVCRHAPLYADQCANISSARYAGNEADGNRICTIEKSEKGKGQCVLNLQHITMILSTSFP